MQYDVNFTTSYNVRNWKFNSGFKRKFIGSQNSDDGTKNDWGMNHNLSWSDGDMFKDDYTVSVVQSSDNDHEEKESFRFNYRGGYGRVNYALNHDDDNTSYNANWQSSFLIQNFNFAFGGSNSQQSGVIVKLKGKKNKDINFEVLNSSRYEDSITIGSSSAIIVAPFTNNNISLKIAGDDLVDLDSEYYEFVAFLGSVLYYEVKARKSAIILGSIASENGDLVVNATINSTLEESYSDESGFFQIYGYIGDNLTVTKEGGAKCTAQIDQNLESDENGMLFVDSVICK